MKIVFGAIYIFATIVFSFHFYLNIFSLTLSLALAAFLIGKGVISALVKSSPLSAVDSVAGFYFLLLSLSVFPNNVATVAFLIFIGQKGFFNIVRGFE